MVVLTAAGAVRCLTGTPIGAGGGTGVCFPKARQGGEFVCDPALPVCCLTAFCR
ncbi:hypothetical protein GCM10010512_45600 [Streptomyces thermoviolaceus subsp. thermoviolaceus]|nr:hypothetical protein GCM10010512_45600 [Streptomyces thermoviolaceus subsp. thermoviolaceus]